MLRHIAPQPAFPLLVTSFSVTALQTVRRTRPDLPLGLACLCPPDDPSALRRDLGLCAIHINDAFATAGRIAAVRDAGLGVAVATVNDPARLGALLALGAHGVMTDHAALAQRFA